MFLVRLHSGSAISALCREAAAALARELLRVEEGEALCWVRNRLIVTNRLGNMTDRWAELREVS